MQKERKKRYNNKSVLFLWLLISSFALITPAYGQGEVSIGDELIELDYLAPKEFLIGGITVTGIKHLDKNAIKLISGLSVGDRITLPSELISNAVKNLWKQGLFDDVAIYVTKVEDETIFLEINLKERPRLALFSFKGIRKGEADNVRDEIDIKRGDVVTENLLTTTKTTIKDYFIGKGFLNVSVKIVQIPDTSHKNYVRLLFDIKKNKRVRINKIHIDGNTDFSDYRIKQFLKETKEKGYFDPFNGFEKLLFKASKDIVLFDYDKLKDDTWEYFNNRVKLRIFKPSKFLKDKYEEDKVALINKYNSFGFRDATILKDSIVKNKNGVEIYLNINEGNKYFFRDINWIGNTKYTEEQLSRVLRIHKGDLYNWESLTNNLTYNQNEDDVSSLYMNDGYLFFQANPVEVNVEGDSIDLEVRIYEGKQATINKVTVSGNTRTMDHVIFREIRTRPGDLFSRSNLIRTTRELSQLGYFNQERIAPEVNPNPSDGTVDLNYSVEETSSDQIELSGGWGYGHVIGTLGVSFNNFAARNIFKKKAWRPVPIGGGQKLSLRFQTTGGYYTSFSASFTEPWLGGKKPNALSVSLYHTTFNRSGVTWWEAMKDSTKKREAFIIDGLTIGLGKRLRWPDDFFQLYTAVNFQRYTLDNYSGNFAFDTKDGKFNNFSGQITLSRNSTDGFIYPRNGSDMSITAKFTLPYSQLLWPNRDYSSLKSEEKYKWIEYHKWNIKFTQYTKLTGDLVIMTRAKMGFLGSYNEALGVTPFERFHLGGDGLTGYNNFDGREIIGMRGYKNSSITPAGGGTIYSKYTMELRYPLSLAPTATIFVLSFVEAGNNWKDFKTYDPFRLNRSAGLGVRIFLPMFGLLGLDWGYGLDEIPGNPDANRGQFHFSINSSID
jgi:outer membrane protein insertion porin family